MPLLKTNYLINLFLDLCSVIFFIIRINIEIITKSEDTANADTIDSDEPDRYKASISSGKVNVFPLAFDNAFTAPNSPHALAVQRIIP